MTLKQKICRTSILIVGIAIWTSTCSLTQHAYFESAVMAASTSAPITPAAAPDASQSAIEIYEMNCLACHAAEGRGTDKYPALVSDGFKKKLGSYDKAYDYIARSMPQNAPASLRDEDYQAVTQYILSLNGIPAGFDDIAGHWGRKEIIELYDKKFIDGYIDSQQGTISFKPDQHITRGEFIRYLVRAKELFVSNSADTDLTDIAGNKEDKVYIITAVEHGLINGYPDHTFRPDNSITRAEIAAILSRSEISKPQPGSSFSDVASDYWAGDAIRAMQQSHLFNGYEDGTFRPDNKMTRGEAVAVIFRLIHAS